MNFPRAIALAIIASIGAGIWFMAENAGPTLSAGFIAGYLWSLVDHRLTYGHWP